MRENWPAFLDGFFGTVFNEPHSTKPYEDAVHDGWATDGPTVAMGLAGWMGHDMSSRAQALSCPTLVIHGDASRSLDTSPIRTFSHTREHGRSWG